MLLHVSGSPRVPPAGCVVGVLPALPELLPAGTPTQTLREQSRAADDERRRRNKDAARESNYELTAADATMQAERDVAPGSAAFRRAETRAAVRQHALQSHAAFRAELAQAAPRPPSAGVAVRSESSGGEPALPGDDSAPLPQKNSPTRPLAAAPAASKEAVPSPARSSASARADAKPDTPALLDLLPKNSTGASSALAAAAPSSAHASAASTTRTAAAIGAPSTVAATSAAADSASATAAPVGRGEVASAAKADTALGGADVRRAATETVRTAPRSAPPTRAPTGKDDANVEHIVRVVASRIGKDRSIATLRLDPAELGSIKLHMDLRDQRLNLRVESESPVAHRLLVERVEALRAALGAADIRLERIEFVTTAPPRDSANADQGRDPSQPHPDAAGSTPERFGSQGDGQADAEHALVDRRAAGSDEEPPGVGDAGDGEAAAASVPTDARRRAALSGRVNILA
ncbi:MAG: flagellar hook-length control protein FliK [Phycisphaerae bacterium]